jgi:hypothetical protein
MNGSRRHFEYDWGAYRASRVLLGALAERLFPISDLWSLTNHGSGRENLGLRWRCRRRNQSGHAERTVQVAKSRML